MLGGFRVWSEQHGELRLPAGGRVSELLARLALAGEAGCSRAETADEFWPGIDPTLARQRLRQALTEARRSLAGLSFDFDSLLDVTRHQIRLRPGACDSDVSAFLAAARSGDLRSADRLRLVQISVLQSLAVECEESGDLTSAIDAATRLAALSRKMRAGPPALAFMPTPKTARSARAAFRAMSRASVPKRHLTGRPTTAARPSRSTATTAA